jgi:hypothetical protein
MAGWALGLAIVPCCGGITTLVAIGLAITVLVKSRHGVNHGKGLAISALIIAGLWLVAGVVAVILGVFNDLTQDADRDSTGQVTQRDEISTSKVRVGDCLDDPGMFGIRGEADRGEPISAVPCDQPHQFEAYFTFELDGDRYPGEERARDLASRGCDQTFSAFVGRPYQRSQLEQYMYYPSSGSWRLLKDHSVICLVGSPNEVTTGTLEGSRR